MFLLFMNRNNLSKFLQIVFVLYISCGTHEGLEILCCSLSALPFPRNCDGWVDGWDISRFKQLKY